MKRIAQILIIMSLLLVPTFISNVNSSPVNNISQLNNETSRSISVNQGDLLNGLSSRPILDSVYNTTATSSLLDVRRERNDSQGHGAIHEMGIYQNVTVRYKVVNANENDIVRLYLDAPAMNITATGSNYSLSLNGNENQSIVMKYLSSSTELENYTLPYDKDLGQLIHVNISTYEAEFNMTSNYVRYFAAVIVDGQPVSTNYETLVNSPFNFITTQQSWTSNSVDEFYIQTELPEIHIKAINTTVDDTYGISYRTSPTGLFTSVNYTFPVTVTEFEENITLPTFTLGTVVEWFTYAYVKDIVNGTTTLVLIERTEYKRVKMEDGTPSIYTEIDSQHEDKLLVDKTLYSQSGAIDFAVSATVVKGQIVTFNLTLGTNVTILATLDLDVSGNISTEGEFFNFTHNFVVGTHDILLNAITDKGIEINNTYTVVIDQTAPTLSLKEELERTEVVSTSGTVTFVFSFEDELSGVREAFLDLGDGLIVEVTDKTEYTHNYLEYNEIGYRITLTVVDFAGNEETSEVLQIRVVAESIGETSAPNAELWFLILAVVIGIVAYKYRENIADMIKR